MLTTWGEVRAEATRARRLVVDHGDEIAVEIAGGGRRVVLRQREALGMSWVQLAAIVCPMAATSAHAGLRLNLEVAVGTVALDRDTCVYCHSLPIERLTMETLRHAIEHVAREAERLDARLREDRRVNLFDNIY